MNPLQPFLDAYGPSHDCETVPEERLHAYEGVLPAPLLEFWRAEGLCGYRDGMFWFVDPDLLRDALEEWQVKGHTAFARNAFGDLFLWSADGVSILSVQLGSVNHLGNLALDVYLNKLAVRQGFVDDLLYGRLHPRAVKMHGRVGPDEAYTFVPALALGGPGTVETVERVKLQEHLSILAQIHGW